VRRVLICVAFATWSFSNFWFAIAERRVLYFLREAPLRAPLPAVIGWEALLTVAMLLAWRMGAAHPRWRRRTESIFLGACILPVGIASAALLRLSPLLTRIVGARFFWPAAALAAVWPLIQAARHPEIWARAMRAAFLWSWPVLTVVMFQAAVNMLRYGSQDYADRPTAPRLRSSPRDIRVVWIIFDEASQAMAFSSRPPGLSLPNFDRLRRESFYATAAVAPGGETRISMPALILGEHVINTEPDGPSDLRVETARGAFSWNCARNVFDDAREAGFNTAVVGWYHPYGRLLNRSLTEYFWTATGVEPGLEAQFHASAPGAMLDRAWLQVASLPLSGHLSVLSPLRYQRRVRARDFRDLMERASRVAADPEIGLVLAHLPVPHSPGFYDRAASRIDADHPSSYIDNLALADRALGDLRRAIEQAGLSDRTALIVSADHGWRTAMWRTLPGWTRQDESVARGDTSGVPFLVQLPNESAGMVYKSPFDTIITRGLITEILHRRITTLGQIAQQIASPAFP